MNIKETDFRKKHLALSDVWAWSTDLHESEDSLVPLPLTEEALAGVDSLLIRAQFVTARGNSLEGLVVYAMANRDVFAIEILVENEKFTFNKFVSTVSQTELRRLAANLGEEASQLLPIKYNIVPSELDVAPGLFSF